MSLIVPSPENTCLVIPTFNAGPLASNLAKSIAGQTFRPSRWLVIDSSSHDGTPDIFRAAGAEVITIKSVDFDHGGTRQWAADICRDKEYIIYLTHDALPASPDAFFKLIAPFSNERVGLCYGRQLPRKEAGPLEAQARFFNYPAEDHETTPKTASNEGVRATFCSNSFSAYRISALRNVGGFPSGTIFGEDAIVAGRMLLSGWCKIYCAGAAVIHSHDYSVSEEARRYFDVGVLHAREPWIRKSFGAAEGAGIAFLRNQAVYLAKKAPHLIPFAIARAVVKYIFYRLGLREAMLPIYIKRCLSMNKRYWRT